MTINELLASSRIFLPSADSQRHMLRVVEYAASVGRLPHLVERINYLAPREDEVIVFHRDGRPEEHSFFWQQISLAEHRQAIKASTGLDLEYHRDIVIDAKFPYEMPNRKTYHGGLICRAGYDPVEWSIHT